MAAELRVAAGDVDLALVKLIRHEVFVVEQGVPAELEYDEYDATAVHVLALADGMALGTGRLIHGAEALGKTGIAGRVLLGRLAVRKAARGTGLGAELVRALEQAGREHGGTELELHAQVQALGFYERLGYVAEGPVYDDAGIPHRTMTRKL
ncbi:MULTISPECIES: GNAT family N-acetyltransferase [unclassified Kitasatospora]|uniref:GNAT family N-acetyltransferase n=1 Tax=unclassified Kitasatospora TaxID=2633591 RepID=UPI00070B833E|nr:MULTISPECIES: GNAT family N-acetyltransferase [unclassified Kitasatospora]KQV16899.1 acetyltransferase [Kitasatospora sp. Root107]KRB73658.1 acetyltransferase [Kitasatospora sp. Root187]